MDLLVCNFAEQHKLPYLGDCLQCAKMNDLTLTGSVVEGTRVHSIPELLVVVVVLFSWVF